MNVSLLLSDVRLAVRSMARETSFTVAALLSLALGIGANTALFSVVYGVLLKPLPYADADRLLRVSEFHPGATSAVSGPMMTNFTYHAWQDSKTLEGIAAFSGQRFTDTSGPEPVKIPGVSMSPIGFRLLGVTPLIGRLLIDGDAAENAPEVAVISEGLWRERFGADPSTIGKTMVLDDKTYTIVGVTPRNFYFPDRDGRIWTPSRVRAGSVDPTKQSVSFFGAFAKLKPGVTPQQAAEEGTLAARGQKRPPVVDAVFGKGGPVTVRADLWLDDLTARIRPALFAFVGGAVFILLIACSNVASLQLTRGVARQKEIAIRTALGAGRGRLVTQLMTESIALAGLGGVLGLAIGRAILAALPSLAPRGFPRIDDIVLDRTGVIFAFGATLFAGLLSGLFPAIRSARSARVPALREGAGASASVATQRLRAGLVMAEAALAVILLIGAGLLIRSFDALMKVDPGYASDGVLIARLDPGGQTRTPEATRDVIDQILGRVRSLPGVTAAGAGNMAPFDLMSAVRSFDIPMESAPGGRLAGRATYYVFTPGFADALSLRVTQGRLFRAADASAPIDPVMVNEEFVRHYLNDGKPVVGRQLLGLVNGKPDAPTEIIGVVQNLLKNSLDQKPLTEMFSVAGSAHALGGWFQVAVHTSGDPVDLAPTLRALVRDIDSRSTVEVATLASRLEASVAQPRFAALIIAGFATLAMTLAAVGLYGALSYSVSQRRREMGVRSALGASPGNIVGLVFRQGLAVTAGGLAIGLLGAALTSRLLSALLFGVTPFDPMSFVVAPTVLFAAASIACVVPAWRGARVPPTAALRCE